MKRFINKEICIKCNTEEEAIKFLELCEKEGLKWRTGNKPSKFIPSEFPCIISYSFMDIKGLGYVWLFEYINGQPVEFQDFIKEQHPKEPQPKEGVKSLIEKLEHLFRFLYPENYKEIRYTYNEKIECCNLYIHFIFNEIIITLETSVYKDAINTPGYVEFLLHQLFKELYYERKA